MDEKTKLPVREQEAKTETEIVVPGLQPAIRFCVQHLRHGLSCENRTAESQQMLPLNIISELASVLPLSSRQMDTDDRERCASIATEYITIKEDNGNDKSTVTVELPEVDITVIAEMFIQWSDHSLENENEK